MRRPPHAHPDTEAHRRRSIWVLAVPIGGSRRLDGYSGRKRLEVFLKRRSRGLQRPPMPDPHALQRPAVRRRRRASCYGCWLPCAVMPDASRRGGRGHTADRWESSSARLRGGGHQNAKEAETAQAFSFCLCDSGRRVLRSPERSRALRSAASRGLPRFRTRGRLKLFRNRAHGAPCDLGRRE